MSKQSRSYIQCIIKMGDLINSIHLLLNILQSKLKISRPVGKMTLRLVYFRVIKSGRGRGPSLQQRLVEISYFKVNET